MKHKKHIECKDCTLNTSTLFEQLSEEEYALLNYDKNCQAYKRGDFIFHEGNHATGFYCVNEGIIKLYKTGPEGREQIITFARQGDIIGYRSVLSKETFCTTAKVITDAFVCFIPATRLFKLVETNTDFSLKLIQQACKELGDANKYITDIAQKTVKERLAEVLLNLLEQFGRNEDDYLNIPLTREELANLVGTATESVIRMLSQFKSQGLIELKGRKIKVIKTNELKMISEQF
ncbi:MAG TPA: Crp/Fnr family transcriptional regulator [Salinivirga sp.]|uniref:Crp/Fnr family transcriptional regulator n=1 Tax=Salinivirga sp. TaxID=1970192 RepID=UPI002B4750F9|nr:Crp/Fnr family transcriptional regulator [Salinivirga sp.]HKK58909.1 Crp/Fnr family transcriptional regulator [Salinivirga sp.]